MYDITDFAKSHPGGSQLLALAVGRDATILFESHHVRPEIVAKTLKTLPKVDTDVNLCPDESFPKPLDSPIYKRIQQRVRDEIMAPLEKTKGRVPSGRGGCQLDAAAVLAFFVASLAWYVHSPSILSGCVLGIAGYRSGTGLQHTANHGGLCLSSWWNQAWGWFGSDVVIGKASLEWRYHHMVSHHSYCNDHERDQDVYTSFPLIRLDENQQWSWFHKYQQLYTPFVWPLLYAAPQVGDFVNIFVNKASPGVEYIGITASEVWLYAVGKILHFGITLALPAYLHGIEKVWAPFLAYGCAGSFVLCWFFIVSHNLDGLRPNQLSKETKADWGRWQLKPPRRGGTRSGPSSPAGSTTRLSTTCSRARRTTSTRRWPPSSRRSAPRRASRTTDSRGTSASSPSRRRCSGSSARWPSTPPRRSDFCAASTLARFNFLLSASMSIH